MNKSFISVSNVYIELVCLIEMLKELGIGLHKPMQRFFRLALLTYVEEFVSYLPNSYSELFLGSLHGSIYRDCSVRMLIWTCFTYCPNIVNIEIFVDIEMDWCNCIFYSLLLYNSLLRDKFLAFCRFFDPYTGCTY